MTRAYTVKLVRSNADGQFYSVSAEAGGCGAGIPPGGVVTSERPAPLALCRRDDTMADDFRRR